LFEANAVPGQTIQGRSANVSVAITMNVIGTQRIDGHQKDVRQMRLFGS